jgi:hypothetical protein
MSENSAPVQVDFATLFTWGVFRDVNGCPYVNKYIRTQTYPTMVKGDMTHEEAVKFVETMGAEKK